MTIIMRIIWIPIIVLIVTYLISERWLQASGGLVKAERTLSCSANSGIKPGISG